MKLVPKRRFKGFSGEWRMKKLGDAVEAFEYGLNVSATGYDGKNKYLRITDIDDETRVFNRGELTSPKVDFVNASDYLLQKGDILFARTGASVGKTYHYRKTDGKVYFAGFLIRGRIRKTYNSEFIFQNTFSAEYRHFIKITSQRSGQPGVNAQEYANYSLMIPSKEEQDKIGKLFNKIDQSIGLAQSQLEKLHKMKQAYLHEMFPAEGESVPKRRFASFTGHWRRCKLKDAIFSEIKGIAKAEMRGTESKYLEVNYLNGGSKSYVDSPQDVDADDVLILWDGSQAGTVYHGFKGALGSTLKAYKPKYSGKFLYQFLKKNQALILQKYRTPNIPHVIKTFTDEFSIDLPCPEEQKAIGEFFGRLDRRITMQEAKVEKLKAMKKAYLEEMFV